VRTFNSPAQVSLACTADFERNQTTTGPVSLPHYHRNENPLQFLLIGNPNWLEDVELPIEALYTPFRANFWPLNQRYHWSMHCPPLGNTADRCRNTTDRCHSVGRHHTDHRRPMRVFFAASAWSAFQFSLVIVSRALCRMRPCRAAWHRKGLKDCRRRVSIRCSGQVLVDLPSDFLLFFWTCQIQIIALFRS
jgi:hypothetical protein